MQENTIICGDWIEVAETLPSGIAHLIITSPPYWGQRNYGVDGQLGLEKTPEEHIEKLVIGFRELRRVLRNDGVVFLNYGDKYNSTPPGQNPGGFQGAVMRNKPAYNCAYPRDSKAGKLDNLKQGDLIGLAWRLALALQADGWYLRSDIIWAKALSFCEKYSGSTMPESVNGWRWERHRVKVKAEAKSRTAAGEIEGMRKHSGYEIKEAAQWKDCPGCAKCAPDGLILRKGSWRPTRAHEYLFLLAKTSNYYADMEAVREDYEESSITRYALAQSRTPESFSDGKDFAGDSPVANENLPRRYKSGQGRVKSRGQNADHLVVGGNNSGRNLRDVFCINPQAYPDSHYATFPEKLVEPCIKVATSQKGCCPKCGAQWARIMDISGGSIGQDWNIRNDEIGGKRAWDKTQKLKKQVTNGTYSRTTLGWLPTCKCGIKETVPAIVYDPFMGPGTVAAVAARLGRNYIGSELNEDYVKNQAEYRVAEGETGISKEEQRQGQKSLFTLEKQ